MRARGRVCMCACVCALYACLSLSVCPSVSVRVACTYVVFHSCTGMPGSISIVQRLIFLSGAMRTEQLCSPQGCERRCTLRCNLRSRLWLMIEIVSRAPEFRPTLTFQEVELNSWNHRLGHVLVYSVCGIRKFEAVLLALCVVSDLQPARFRLSLAVSSLTETWILVLNGSVRSVCVISCQH